MDTTAGNLLYVRANDGLGSSWPPPSDVDNSGLVGSIATDGNFTSLKIVAGFPAIAYYREQKLYFVRALDAQGSTWITPFSLDGDVANDVGECASMAIVDGNPAIAYYDRTNGDLKYIRAIDEFGAFWSAPINLGASGDDDGWSACLNVVGGYPMVSYHNLTASSLWLAASSTSTGTSGLDWSSHQCSSTADFGLMYTSLIDIGGFPAISFLDSLYMKVCFVRTTDPTLFTWHLNVAPNQSDVVAHGSYSSMVIYNGAPAISYYHSGSLGFVTAADANGDSWNAQQFVDSPAPPEDVGSYTSLAVIGGNPAISYYDAYYGELKFAMLY